MEDYNQSKRAYGGQFGSDDPTRGGGRGGGGLVRLTEQERDETK